MIRPSPLSRTRWCPGCRLPTFTWPCRCLLPGIVLDFRLVLRGRIPQALVLQILLSNLLLRLRLASIERRRGLALVALQVGSSSRHIGQSRLGGPAGVGLGGEGLDAVLARQVGGLLRQRGGILALVPQPLVPLRRHLDVREVRRPRVLHDAPPAQRARVDVLVYALVAERPVRVTAEVEACGIRELVVRVLCMHR